MPRDEIREITDARVLAAMAHPLRRRLIDVLQVHGPATASMLAGRTDQSVANVSHHLRMLHRSTLIDEAPELARDRRERWWRLVSGGLRWTTGDFEKDPVGAVVAQAAGSLTLEHHTALVRAWLEADQDARARWDHADFSTSKWLHLTPAELAELANQVIELIGRWSTATGVDDGEGREPVFIFAYGVPGRP